MDAMRESGSSRELGETGVGGGRRDRRPARATPWSMRVTAVTRRFRGEPLRERVLLVLPVGRSPPRGSHPGGVRPGHRAASCRERLRRASVARAAGHPRRARGVELARGRSPRRYRRLRRRLRDRVESAVARGSAGVRRALVLGVVLGEDEGLPADVQEDFRASGTPISCAVSGQNVAYLACGVYGLGWLLRLLEGRPGALHARARSPRTCSRSAGSRPSSVRESQARWRRWRGSWRRPRERWHFLALGALVLLAWTPTSLLEPGFQLSFAAVAGIFLGVARLQRAP